MARELGRLRLCAPLNHAARNPAGSWHSTGLSRRVRYEGFRFRSVRPSPATALPFCACQRVGFYQATSPSPATGRRRAPAVMVPVRSTLHRRSDVQHSRRAVLDHRDQVRRVTREIFRRIRRQKKPRCIHCGSGAHGDVTVGSPDQAYDLRACLHGSLPMSHRSRRSGSSPAGSLAVSQLVKFRRIVEHGVVSAPRLVTWIQAASGPPARSSSIESGNNLRVVTHFS